MKPWVTMLRVNDRNLARMTGQHAPPGTRRSGTSFGQRTEMLDLHSLRYVSPMRSVVRHHFFLAVLLAAPLPLAAQAGAPAQAALAKQAAKLQLEAQEAAGLILRKCRTHGKRAYRR